MLKFEIRNFEVERIMTRQVVLTALLVLSWGVTDAAPPAEKGAYIGGGFGPTSLEDDGLFSGLTFDDSDSGFGIFGGYKFFKYLAVEARYADFGTFTVEGLGIDASVVSVHAVGIIPFADSGLELFGQLGLGTVDISIPGDSTRETVGSADTIQLTSSSTMCPASRNTVRRIAAVSERKPKAPQLPGLSVGVDLVE